MYTSLKSRMELETLDERPRRKERSEDEAYDEWRDTGDEGGDK